MSAHETVGLIGPNGAGKTTLFELLSGFVAPDEGTVMFAGADVTRTEAAARGQLGLIRSFQEAALFPTMTVLDTVVLAHERVTRSSVLDTVVGRRRPEKVKAASARDLVTLMGLGRYRDHQIASLSTGTRRIVEIACLVALQPKLLLLDEPAAGVAQRETEALADLLGEVRSQLGCALVVIEHDIALISSMSDRLVAMDAGRVIVAGTPAEVQAHPDVVSAFLGGDVVAIERSGARSTH